jgi:PTH1 family peptidyl-tRNA hydrolase
MLLIYGLGNNDQKYLHTKHNAGRVVVETLAQEFGLHLQKKDKYFYGCFSLGDKKGILLLSTGFMNTSGEPLTSYIHFFKIPPQEIKLLIVHDDSDQIEGRWKLVQGGRSAGHKGIDSIYKHLPGLGIDLEQVWRLKIGIRPNGNTTRSETFVLSNFSLKEMENYRYLAERIIHNLHWIEQDHWSKFQTEINKDG